MGQAAHFIQFEPPGPWHAIPHFRSPRTAGAVTRFPPNRLCAATRPTLHVFRTRSLLDTSVYVPSMLDTCVCVCIHL